MDSFPAEAGAKLDLFGMKYRTLGQIVDHLERCSFRCKAGPLERHVAFEELRDLSDRLGEIRLDDLAPSASSKNKSSASITREAICAKAAEAQAKWPNDPEVRRQVDALMSSYGDTLSNRVIFAELEGIAARGRPSFVVKVRCVPTG